jgi:hypothetical protein
VIEGQLISSALPYLLPPRMMRSQQQAHKTSKGENMKSLNPEHDCKQRVSLAKRIRRTVLIAVAVMQLGLYVPAIAAEDTENSGLRFNHAEYMKATAAGQKKVEPALKGDLCFDTAGKKIEFLSGEGAPAFSIDYGAVKSLLYEQANKPRYTEAVLISPLFLLSHSKKHFLTIQYTDSAGAGQFVIVHLDKKNAQQAIAAAESQTGKTVDRVEEK